MGVQKSTIFGSKMASGGLSDPSPPWETQKMAQNSSQNVGDQIFRHFLLPGFWGGYFFGAQNGPILDPIKKRPPKPRF